MVEAGWFESNGFGSSAGSGDYCNGNDCGSSDNCGV